MTARKQGAHSVARRGFGVAPSPFNIVKLDLGLWLLGIAPYWWLSSLLAGEAHLAWLFAYGMVAAGQLIWRTRRLLREQEERTDGAQ